MSVGGQQYSQPSRSSAEGAADALRLLGDLARAAEPDRATLVDEFLAAAEPVVRYVAMDLCRAFKADRNTWVDDFAQIVRLEAYHLAMECAGSPRKADEIQSLKAILGYRGRSKVTAFIDSSAGFNQASGMASWKRRRKELERTRAHLWSLYHREPTDEEIVEETNRRLRESRADINRQGMECKVEDLHISDSCETLDGHDASAVTPSVESDSDLHRTERARLVMLCIAACDQESAVLGQVARLWFVDACNDDYDEPPSAASIARQLGMEPSTARVKVARMKAISQQVARDQFGFRQEEQVVA